MQRERSAAALNKIQRQFFEESGRLRQEKALLEQEAEQAKATLLHKERSLSAAMATKTELQLEIQRLKEEKNEIKGEMRKEVCVRVWVYGCTCVWGIYLCMLVVRKVIRNYSTYIRTYARTYVCMYAYTQLCHSLSLYICMYVFAYVYNTIITVCFYCTGFTLSVTVLLCNNFSTVSQCMYLY